MEGPKNRHKWLVMMLGPEDVDDLIKNEGMSTDMIDELRLFYNTKIKNRTLD